MSGFKDGGQVIVPVPLEFPKDLNIIKKVSKLVVNKSYYYHQVKRLMGRGYYDDPDHKFVYRVRPTLKSHSLKGVRAAVEIPCGKFRKKLVQPELISALILRHVADHAQR
jgi:molecular chaperone DnaK (HSP70)